MMPPPRIPPTTTQPTAQSRSPPTSANADTDDPQTVKERERVHQRFVQALERYGSTGDGYEWHDIADSMGWDVRQTKIYAYEYLMELCGENGDGISSVALNGATAAAPAQITNKPPQNEWSHEECILFDTLLSRYYPVNTPSDCGNAEEEMIEWEERVASLLPSKTSKQVRERFESLYGDQVTARARATDKTGMNATVPQPTPPAAAASATVGVESQSNLTSAADSPDIGGNAEQLTTAKIGTVHKKAVLPEDGKTSIDSDENPKVSAIATTDSEGSKQKVSAPRAKDDQTTHDGATASPSTKKCKTQSDSIGSGGGQGIETKQKEK